MATRIRITDQWNELHGEVVIPDNWKVVGGAVESVKDTTNENIRFLRDVSQKEELKDVDYIVVMIREDITTAEDFEAEG